MNKRGNSNSVRHLICMFSQESIWYEKWMISFSLVSLIICASSQREQTLERYPIQKERSIESSYINPKLYLRNGTHPISVSQAPNASSSIFVQPDDFPCANRDFSNIPVAKTVSESKKFLEARIKRVVKCGIEIPLEQFPVDDRTRSNFVDAACARLVTRTQIDEVNEILLRPESQQWGRYGSSVLPDLIDKKTLSNSCLIREGDYDFTAQSLVRSAYLGSTSDEVLLFPETQKKVLFKLLPSGRSKNTFTFDLCVDDIIFVGVIIICASSQREQTLEKYQIQKERSIESSYINPKLYLRNGTYASHPISVSQAPNASSSIFVQPDDFPCANRDFSNIPVAKTVSESKKFLEARIKRVVKCGIEIPLEQFPVDDRTRSNFVDAACARLVTRTQIDEVNEILLRPESQQWGRYGSSVRPDLIVKKNISNSCLIREGDYDFTAQSLVRSAYLGSTSDEVLLFPETQKKVLFKLLPSGRSKNTFTFDLCGQDLPETENHVLMHETSRYITNQLIIRQDGLTDLELQKYDNSRNGFNEWMLEYIQGFFINYFYEYNAKPYQSYSVMAIENLFAFAEDERVKLAAEMLLDLLTSVFAVQSNGLRRDVHFRRQDEYEKESLILTSVFAVQSNGLRRVVPFRRQDEYEKESLIIYGDAESSRMAVLAGNYEYLRANERPLIKKSSSYGGYGGEKFDDKDDDKNDKHYSFPGYPLISKLEICTGDRVFGLKYSLRDGLDGINRFHGSCRSGTSSSIKLDWEEYLIKMVVHTSEHEETTRVSYVEFLTNKGQILAGGTKTSQVNIVNTENGGGLTFHITGFYGRSGNEIDELGAILTPVEYMYENRVRRDVYSTGKMLAAVVSKYRIPDILLDIIIRKDNNYYFQKIRHDGVEMYSSSKSFIINAGGIFEKTFLFGATEQHGWALPTTIMPTLDPTSDYDNW
eukprot:CAMPEP_0194394078 /NCGR_PEP_ID=MMETSP0174-20130528/123656_1 /TAXON_ID=216777 /ORGANISM="Proboscia alata, Strain PI-D3" /LENGTH=932 /DNA_ID=CAMNT_0039189839 /DNA_START=70 /DNA_END=2866 /DNA_ORIENTATION=-